VCWGDGSCEAELCDLACEAAGLGFGRGAILSRQAEAVMLERDVDGRSLARISQMDWHAVGRLALFAH